MRGYAVLKTIALVLPAAVFIALPLALSGCGKSADDLYSGGKQLLLNEKTQNEGMEIFLRFEKKFPDDPRTPEVILAVATVYQSRGNFDEAAGTFKRLIEKYPDSAEAYKGMFLLAYMYYDDIKDEEKAKSTLKNFIEMYPDSELTVSAGVLLENIGLPVENWSIVKKLNLLPEK